MLMLKRRQPQSISISAVGSFIARTVGSSTRHHPAPMDRTFPCCRLPFPWAADPAGHLSVGTCEGFGRNRAALGLRITGCTQSGLAGRPVVPDPEQRLLLRVEDGRLFDGKPLGGGKFPDFSLLEKVVVAVDVDEVLGNFVSALNRFIRDRYDMYHSVSEYHVYEFFKIWNCSRDEADIRVHEFFKTPYFKTGIHPLPGSQKALHKLSRLFKFSVVTSRQNVIKDHTIEWLENHYPGLFDEIHFGNHFALTGESRPKSEICKSLGARVLIDDNPKYAIECAETGVRVLLFDYENSYPWCKTDSVNQHPLVTRVHNWEQVEQELASLIVSQSSVT